jgi:hypothetical protein
VNSAIAIPSKTNQQITIAIALDSFFSTKGEIPLLFFLNQGLSPFLSQLFPTQICDLSSFLKIRPRFDK